VSGGEHRPRGGFALVAILLVVYTIAYLDRQIVSLLVEPLKADLAISDVQLSFLQGFAFVLFYTVCGLPIGFLVDRYSRKLIVIVGLLTWSIASAGAAFADSYGELLAARFVVGAGEAALLPAAYSMLGDAFPAGKLSRAMSVFSLGAIAGGALALSAGGQIAGYATDLGGMTVPGLGRFEPWQMVFLLIGSLGLPGALLLLGLREPARSRTGHANGAGTDENVGTLHFRTHWRFYLCHFAGFALLCMLMAASSAWQPAFIQRTFGWGIREVGSVLGALHLVGGIAGMLGSGALADWLQARGHADAHLRIYVFAMPAIVVAALAAYASGTLWIALSGIAMISVMAPFIAVAASGLALGTPPDRRGIASAAFLFVYNIVGFGAGPTVAAWLASQMPAPGDLGTALALMFVVISPIAILLFLGGLRPMRGAVAAARTH
jgi:MFS family permease